MMVDTEEIQDLKIAENNRRITALENCVNGENGIIAKINQLIAKQDTVKTILVYVVTPLIVILGALVGVKIAIPTF